ncbi:hypothetical protein BJV82DRAFT_585446 [Fennellomyces sp. T-0311]|nr:hypothetical protein BJV82DRAFT_585446 [Fennellomyces sp. T-0311]
MQTLYAICLETIADHADSIAEWSGIPFDPFVLDILRAIGEKPGRIKPSIFEGIGYAHGHLLPNHEGAISLAGRHESAMLNAVHAMPRFITHLNLSDMQGLGDGSIHHLKECIHLKVLDISRVDLTDMGVAHIWRMTDLTVSDLGLKSLQVLGLAGNQLSDRCLKHLVKISTLIGIDLSHTSVTDVAINYMKRHQFEVLCAISPPPPPVRFGHANQDGNVALITWHGIDKQHTEYLAGEQRNPGCNIVPNPTLFKIVGQPLVPMRKHAGRWERYFGHLSFARQMPDSCMLESKPKKRQRVAREPSPPQRKQSWPNALDYLKMVEKEMGM